MPAPPHRVGGRLKRVTLWNVLLLSLPFLSRVESSRVADGVCSLLVAILNNRRPNGNGAAASAASVVMVN